MTKAMFRKFSEDFPVNDKTEIPNLPFIKKNKIKSFFGRVKSSGDYINDCQTGREYAALALEHLGQADFGPLLTWCIMDMPRKNDCSGIEVGFLEFFVEMPISNFDSSLKYFRKLSN